MPMARDRRYIAYLFIALLLLGFFSVRSTVASFSWNIADEKGLDAAAPGFIPGLPVDINSAGLDDLKTLPRIGDAIAERILLKRQELGGFRNIEELLLVKGVGKKTFNEISPFVKAEDAR